MLSRSQLYRHRLRLRSGAVGVDRLESYRILEGVSAAWLDEAVRLARSQGATWDEIGNALGHTKQAARQRFLHLEDG